MLIIFACARIIIRIQTFCVNNYKIHSIILKTIRLINKNYNDYLRVLRKFNACLFPLSRLRTLLK